MRPEVEPLQLAMERGAADAERLGCRRYIALGAQQRALQDAALDRKSARGEFGASRRPLTLARAHETENAGLRRKANHGAVRRVVDSVDDPIRRDAQPEWNRHLPTTVD